MGSQWEVTLYVEVDDERQLWEHARQHFIDENIPRFVEDAELDEMFGDGKDGAYKITACLQQVTDPGVNWPGTSIHDSVCEYMDLI